MKVAILSKILGRCLPRGLYNDCSLALASLAQSLLGWRNIFFEDISRLKEARLREVEARTAAAQADASKKIAEAAMAANRVTDKESRKALLNLRLEREAIRNRKMAAEAATAEANIPQTQPEAAAGKTAAAMPEQKMLPGLAIEQSKELSASTKGERPSLISLIEVIDEARRNRLSEAEEELRQALKAYSAEGGTMYVDSDNLRKLLKLK